MNQKYLLFVTFCLLSLLSGNFSQAQNVFVGTRHSCVDDTVSVPIGIINGQGISAISLSLQAPPNTSLQFLGIDSLDTNLSAAQYSVNAANLFAFAWFNLNPVNLNGNLLYLKFKVLTPTVDSFRWDVNNSELADSSATPITSTSFTDGMFFSGMPSTPTFLTATLCQGQSYQVGNQFFGTSGLHSISLTNFAGCDSTVNLNLTIQPADTTRIERVLCPGENTTILGTSYNAPIVIHNNVPTAAGCDSIVEYRVEMMENTLTSTGSCVGSELAVTTNAPDVIRATWRKNGQVVSNLVGGYGPNYSTIMGGQFSHATDVFFHEPTGDIYVSEAGAHRVVKITPGSTTPVLVAGGNGSGSAANQLSGPNGIFVTANGTLFVADAGNHRVQRWLPGSTSGTTVAGGNGAGSLSRQLSVPYDVAVDAQGRIYVSDYNNHRIMRWNAGASSGSVYRSVSHPWGMQLMPNGDLYVAEHHGHLIRRFPANSTTSSVVAVNSTGGCHPTTFVVNPMNEIFVQWIHCARQITRHMPDSTQGVKMFDVPYDGYGLALDGTGSLLVGQHYGWDMLRRYTQNTFDTLRFVSNNEGNYTLDLVRRGGCVSVSNSVTLYGVTSEVQSDKGALICNGDTAILSTIQQSGYTYQWLKNGLEIPGATSPQIQVFEPGTYTLRSTESHGCQALSEPFVVASPSVTTIQSSGQCVGDSVYFSSSDSTITEIRFYSNGTLTQTLFAGLDEGEVVANGFHHASGLACDAQGNMYISDYHHQRVVKWNLNSSSGTNIAAGHGSALNQVNYPTGLFAAPNGDVYLADFYNHRVLKYIAGSGNGVIVAGGNGEGGGLTQLRYPAAVWVKSNGDVMVADRDNHRIVRWSPGATQGVIVAGTGIAGNAANQLNAPSELFIKDDGTMYVSDRSNHRVQRFAPGSTIAQTVAGGNGQGSTLAQLSGPIGILVDAGNNLFVADHSNGRIVVWPQGSSSGIELANSSLVVSPHSLAFAPDGSLLVTEFSHPLGVKRFRFRYLNSFATAAPQNGVVTATALNRNGCILPVGGSVNISSPEFELLSSKGDILCEGDTSILSVQTSGTYTYQWYRDGQAIAGATGQQLSVSQPAQYWVVATNASGCSTTSRTYRVNNVPAVSISTNGACGNNAVLAASGLDSSAVAMTWMKNGQAVGYKGVRYEPIGDAWNSTFLPPWDWYAHPIDVVIDPKGEYLYYTSRNNVYRYRLGGGQHTLMAGGGPAGAALGQLSNPGYMVFDKMGRLYVSDWGNHRVLRYDFSSTVALPVVVAGGNGLGHDSSRLYHPAGLYVDDALNVYVVDNYNHRIQRWAAGASSGVTIAGGNGQGPGLNQLSHPSGLKFDEQGNIFVSDQHNHRVMRWSPGSTSGVVVAGGNGAGSAMHQLTYPTDLELDKAGGLVVADHHGHRIIRVAPTSNIGEVIAGGNGVGGSSLQLYHPHGVALDQAGRLYVTDNHNHRIMRYFHYGIDSSVYRPARGGDYQARVFYRNGCYSESNSVHVGKLDTTILGGSTPVALCQGQTLQVGQQSISTPGYHEVLLTNADGCDSLVQAFVVVKPVSQTNLVATICQGQNYILGNLTLSTSGVYSVTLTNQWGCDSVVTLNLTVGQPSSMTISETLCASSSLSLWGNLYNQTGVYQHILVNSQGCDSVVTLNLVVNSLSSTTITERVCSPSTYSFGGQQLSSSGVYTQLLTNALGCDSVVTLELTVNEPSAHHLSASVCAPNTYDFQGQVLNSSGVYSVTLTNQWGCDSVVTLNLTVGQPSSMTISETLCASSSLSLWGNLYNQTGVYQHILVNSQGCDSVVTLNLVVNSLSSTTITERVCSPSTYSFGGQQLSSSGVYTQLLTNALGCDSVVTLELTVNEPSVRQLSAFVCAPNTYNFQGQALNSSGVYSVTLTNQWGCDSVVTLSLEYRSADTTHLFYLLCTGESLQVQGQSLNSAGVYIFNVPTAAGCDSIVEYTVDMMENNLVSSGQCAGAQLTYNSNAPDIMRWEWMNGTEVVRSFTRTHQTTSSWNYGSSHPAGMFFHEATGALYLAEAGPHRVLRWLPGATTPQVVAGGNGAGAAANQLSTPRDVFVTANGSIYVVDAGNDRVQRWDPGATQGITVAGGNGRGGLNSQFNDPYGLWVDEQSRIFVADYGNGRVMQWNAGATSGTVYRTGNGPIDVFFDENRNFYMAQYGAHNVLRWSPGATTPVVVANANHPLQIAVDKAGTVYVAQHHAHMISRHYPGNPNGENMGLSFWCHPFGVAITNSGSLYMNAHHCDHTVRRFDLNMNSFPLPDTLMAALPGNYSVRSTRTNGCVSTSNVVAVGAVPQVSILSTGLGEVCMGNTAVVSTTQVPGITYNWQLDGADITGQTAAQYQITAPGRYRLRATDAQGCTSFSREVIMRPAPSVQLYSSGGCLSDTLSIVTADSNVASVEWYRDGQVVSSRSARYNTGEALITGMNQAFNVFVDASGNVYSVDRENDRILRRTAGSATAVVVAGGNGRGGALSQLNLPTHVFVDAQGVMFIGDGGNHRVLRWMPGAHQGQVVAGGNGQGGGLSQLNTPHGVWVNGQRQIFVVDHGNHRVMRWNPGATTGTVVAGNNIAGGAANQFNGPTSIQFTPNGDMYIADYSNHRIQRWARGATTGVTVAGGNGQGSGRNQLSNPWGFFVDGSGQIYVSDRSNHRVMRWGFGAVEGVQVGGLEGYGNGANQLNDPLGIQVDELGRMYLAEGGRGWIRRFTPQVLSGVPYFASSAGTYTAKVRTFGGCLVEVSGSVAVTHPVLDLQSSVGNLICYGDTAVLSSPYDAGYTYRWYKDGQLMTGMSSNSLTINQPGSYRLEVENAQGCRAVSQILKLLEVPSTNISLQGTCADGLTVMNLTTPLDSQMVAVHWVKGNDIQQVDQRRYEPIGDVEATAHHWPNHLFLGRGGKDLYVSQHNQHRIWKKDLETGAVVTVAGMGGGGSLLNQLSSPHGFYVDARDNIYVADMYNHRVVRYDSAGSVGVVVAGGNGQGGDSTRLSTPYDTWVDQSGNVYVVDHSNHRIQRWAPGARFGVTVAGGNGQGSGLNQLNHPTQMVMDVNGWMYIADNHNHRVLRWRVGDNAGTVVAGGNGAGGGLNQLYHPHALRLDPSGALYIADNHNHRVVRWRPGATRGEVVLGGQGAGGAAVQLTHPQGIEIAPDGKIYVSDNHNHRIMRYFHYGIDSSVYRPARGGDYQARVYYRNGCYAESNSVHVGNIDTTVLGSVPPASIDFEGSLAGWNTTQTHQWNGSTALGPFSNADITYSQSNLAPHDSLTIEFDFYVHDSWDNSEPFQFSLDGQVLGTYNFGYGHTSSYPEFTFLNTMNSRCAGYGGRMYRARFKAPHTSAQMQFRINVWDAEDACNESWSIDNFNVGGGVAVVLCQGQSLQVGQQSISTPGYHEVLLTNAAGCDSLVQAFVVVKPVSQTNLVATICQGQSYTFGNQSLTSSGNYTMNLSNHLDCDSLVTLTLIIQTPIVEHISTSVCSPAVYSFGSLNLTQSGQYVHTFASHAGCDSTVHLNLTVLHPSTFTMAESICQGQTFSFGTQTLTQTGTYTQNLSGVNGCDSLVVLNLHVKPTYSINLTERICSGSTYTFGSQQLSSSGLYTLSLTTHQGCDSIVQLNLLVGSPPPPTVLNEVVCYPSTYTVGNQSFGSSGQYTVVLDDVSGCDSTVVLNLEVRNPSAHTITMTTVGAQFVMVGNQHFNQTGTHIVHLVNAQGCDSVVTLHLTAVPIVVRASNLTTCDGDTILVPLVLENAMGISAMSLTLNYPGQNLRYLGYQQVNPTLNQANLLLNATIVNGVNQVRLAWFNLVPVNISSGILLSLRFVVEQPSFSSLVWDLNNLGMCEFADEFGDSVRNMVYHNGLIHSGGSQSTISATICQGQSYFFDGSPRSSTGVYTSNYPDHLGCDSIVVLNLRVNPTSSVTIYDTIPIGTTYWVSNQSFTHTGVYQVLLSNQHGCDSVVTLHLKVLGYPLNGRLQYNNSNFPGNSTPMTNTTVNLRVGGQIVKSAQTNSLGQFTFGPVDSNTYELSYSHNKPWGGVNATDALTISRHFTNVIPLTGFRLTAGDVNLSSVVNTSDALLITRRYSNLLSSFPSGNWAYSLNSFHIGPRENLYLDIKSLCYGDVNGSYNPSVNARLAWKNVEELNQVVTQTKAYHLDIKAADDFNLGAASMTLRLPNGVKVESVAALCAASQEPVIFKQEGQILRLAWYHLATWNLKRGDGIFRLGLQGLSEGNLEIEEFSSELATENATPIDGLPIAAPRLVNKSLEKAPSVVYPNPSSDHATLEFTLGSKAPVDIQIMDAIGKVVWERLGGDFDQGVHRINLPMVDLAQGVYYVILRKESEAGRVSREAIRVQKVR